MAATLDLEHATIVKINPQALAPLQTYQATSTPQPGRDTLTTDEKTPE